MSIFRMVISPEPNGILCGTCSSNQKGYIQQTLTTKLIISTQTYLTTDSSTY